MEKVLPEDLERKFKSKQDLYELLSIDCKLRSYNDVKYTVICHLLRSVQYTFFDKSYLGIKRYQIYIFYLGN